MTNRTAPGRDGFDQDLRRANALRQPAPRALRLANDPRDPQQPSAGGLAARGPPATKASASNGFHDRVRASTHGSRRRSTSPFAFRRNRLPAMRPARSSGGASPHEREGEPAGLEALRLRGFPSAPKVRPTRRERLPEPRGGSCGTRTPARPGMRVARRSRRVESAAFTTRIGIRAVTRRLEPRGQRRLLRFPVVKGYENVSWSPAATASSVTSPRRAERSRCPPAPAVAGRCEGRRRSPRGGGLPRPGLPRSRRPAGSWDLRGQRFALFVPIPKPRRARAAAAKSRSRRESPERRRRRTRRRTARRRTKAFPRTSRRPAPVSHPRPR